MTSELARQQGKCRQCDLDVGFDAVAGPEMALKTLPPPDTDTHNATESALSQDLRGTPGGTRTPNLLIRSQEWGPKLRR